MKRKVIILLCLVFALLVSGCSGGKNKKKNFVDNNGDVNTIDIFVPTEYGIEKSKTTCQLKQPDSLGASVEELMYAIINEYNGTVVNFVPLFDEENNLKITISLDKEYSAKDNHLIMAAITNTLFELNSIKTINITVLDADGNDVCDYAVDRTTFFLYDYPKEYGNNYVNTTFYLPNDSGDALVKSRVRLYLVSSSTFYERIIKYLIGVKAVPAKTKVNSVAINDRICYIDLSKEFENTGVNAKSSIVIYSIVNTLTSLDNIDKVVILIDGSIQNVYKNTVDISEPLAFNSELVQ